MRLASLDIHKEEFSFSAGHFTIFSATDREPLHGHNYNVSLTFHFAVNQEGLSFDYRSYKMKMRALCKELNTYFLLPSKSPYLKLEDTGDYWIAHFNQKELSFLKEDTVILPLSNITIEELSHWFLGRLLESATELEAHNIHGITVSVYNGPGQSSGASWQKK